MKTRIHKSQIVTAVVLSSTLGIAALGVGGAAISGAEEIPNLQAYATTSADAGSDATSDAPIASSATLETSDYSKTQVVYAKGSATGSVSGIYAVNSFSSSANANIIDEGKYTSVTNLTNTAGIIANGNTCSFTSDSAGEFMYQGDLPSSTKLPWNISVTYKLDGEAIDASELAGKSGALTIKIKIEPTADNDSLKKFCDNYLVQATAKLDNSKCSNISAEGATTAQSSGDTQLSYMVFPGKTGDYTITANVKDFEFDGITVVCVPLSIALDVDDSEFNSATDDLKKLKEAIENLNAGASELEVGSNNVSAGLDALSSMSNTLTGAANSFGNALSSANDGASNLNGAVSDQLSSGMQQLSAGSDTYANTLSSQAEELATETAGKSTESAKAEYAQSLSAYTQTYTAVYTQIYTALILGGTDPTTAAEAAATQAMQNENVQTSLNSLNEKTESLAELSGNLGALQALTSATQGYSGLSDGISNLNSSVGTLAAGSSSLASGLQQLNSAYKDMNSGVLQYAAGVDKLAGNYPTLNSGVLELKSGTNELQNETASIDTKMINSVKDKLTEYLNPTFTMIDFVNGDTQHIKRVQFVYMTDAIEVPDKNIEETEDAQEDKNFFEKLIALFLGE